MKNRREKRHFSLKVHNKYIRIMRITTFLLFLFLFQLSAGVSHSQNIKLSFDINNMTMEEAINQIEKKSNFKFVFTDKAVDTSRKVSIHTSNGELKDVLEQLIRNTGLDYRIVDRLIVLSEKNLQSQQEGKKLISGTILDEKGEPIIGANVMVKGTSTGVVTDIDGNFSIQVPPSVILQISYIGYITQEIAIRNQNVIHIRLAEDTQTLDEVVVVGYGTQKKANLTGATSSVNFGKMESKPAANTATLLQGQMSGVQVSGFDTQPGNDNPEIRIRGIGTFNSGQNPLVLVDGVESSFTQIPSSDIESVSVLKDAASAAIYGVRAANGVILVTTKRGAIQKPSVTIKQNFALQDALGIPDMVDSWDFAIIYNQMRLATGQNELYTPEMIQAMRDGSDPDRFANTDWAKEMYRIAPMNTTYFSVNGGAESVRYMFSGEYFTQQGVQRGTNTDRYSIRSNIDVDINKKIKAGMDISAQVRDIEDTLNSSNEEDGNGNMGYTIRRQSSPLIPVKYQNGEWGSVNGVFNQTSLVYPNPVYLAQKGLKETKKYFMQARFFVDIELYKNLKYRLNAAGVYNASNLKRFSPTEKFYDWDGKLISETAQNSLQNNNARDYKYILENIFTYDFRIKDHAFSLLAGQSAQYYKYEYFTASVKELPNDFIHVLDAGIVEKNVGGNAHEVSLQSFFGRANYNYLDKYLLEMNIRYDGSSRMPKDSRYGLFPSFSGGWVISNEEFMNDFPALSFLKLRGSWGKLGNQEIGNYAYTQNIDITQNYIIGGELSSGAALTTLANPDLKWETTTITDIGLDMNFFRNRLQITADWFNKTSSDILVKLPIPQTMGNLDPPYQNIAKVRNRGVELDVKFNNNIGELGYYAGFNVTKVENEILDIAGMTSWLSNGGRNINLEGHPIGTFYGLVFDGYFQNEEEIANGPTQFTDLKPGDIRYKDLSGPDGVPDGKIDETYDRTINGSPFPDWTYSFNFGGSYKGFDLYCFFQGVSGVDRYLFHNNQDAGNFTTEALDYWTPDNPNAAYPRFINMTNNNKNSTFWLKDASYLRLKNIEIGYTLPRTVISKLGLDNVRVYLSGNNLITFTKMVDMDPEKALEDERARTYPQSKVYSIGLNINF